MRKKVKNWSAPCRWRARIQASNKRVAHANWLIRKNRPIIMPPPPVCSGCRRPHDTTWCPRCDKFEAWCERKGYNSVTIVMVAVFGIGFLVFLAVFLMAPWTVP